MQSLRLRLFALACALLAAPTVADAHPSATSSSALQPLALEPSWGRIYLRHGLAPIQYFRDRYGGPMVDKEVEFYFPRRTNDLLGCDLLPEDEQYAIRQRNGTIALVLERGGCSFETKSRNAESIGAAALVIVSEDEAAKAPIALVDKGEIEIASVMVRKSAGALLRVEAERGRVFGRIVPVVCKKKPYMCEARTAAERQYVQQRTVRSGRLGVSDSDTLLGEFMGATYGGVVPLVPLRVAPPVSGSDACTIADGKVNYKRFDGQAVIISGERSCSVLNQVSNAQLQGARVALVVVEGADWTEHTSVSENWHAYNITIAVATVADAVAAKLLALSHADPLIEVDLRADNSIAQTWDEIRKLEVRSAWPNRRDRQQKLLKRLLSTLAMDNGQLLALKRNFLSVAGGKAAAWEQLVAPEENGENAVAEVPIDASGSIRG